MYIYIYVSARLGGITTPKEAAIWESTTNDESYPAGPGDVPSRERSHIPPWEKETHLQNCLGKGYVSSQEGI